MGSNHMNDFYRRNSAKEKHIAYSEDPLLFIQENWVTVKNGEMQKINPHQYQEQIITDINETPVTLIGQSRQMGISSLIDVYISWLMIFGENKNILILTPNLQSSILHLERIKMILSNYKVDGVFDIINWIKIINKSELILSNGCKIQVRTASSAAGKAESLDLLFIDNAGYIKDLEYIWMAMAMTLSGRSGKAILASSPYDDSFFNKMAIDIQNEPKNDYRKLIEIGWMLNPHYDQNWYKERCSSLGNNKKMIEQELDCVFNYKNKSSKDKTISLRLSQELHKKIQIKIGEEGSISDYIRSLVEKDLRI